MDYMGESELTVSDKDILEGLLLKVKKFKKGVDIVHVHCRIRSCRRERLNDAG